MKYTTLGNTGLWVSRICFGCMNLSETQEEAEDIRMVNEAIDMGINFFDNANKYGHGKSEEVLGKAVKGKRDDLVIATKCWANIPGAKGPNCKGGSRKSIIRAVEDSLKRLQTDYVDLLILHRPDEVLADIGTNPATTEESLSALTDLVRQGKARYIGSSGFFSWKLVEAQMLSTFKHYERMCSEQLYYSLLNRFVEKEVLPVCKKYRIGITIYAPLGSGWLSGKYHRNTPPPEGSRAHPDNKKQRVKLDDPDADRKFDILEKLEPLVKSLGVSMPQFALAWLLHRPLVTSVISGPRTVEHLRDNVKAVDVKLSKEIMDEVDKISPPKTGIRTLDYYDYSL